MRLSRFLNVGGDGAVRMSRGKLFHAVGPTTVNARLPSWRSRVTSWGGGKVRGANLRGGKMRGTVRGINARRWVICEAEMCKA